MSAFRSPRSVTVVVRNLLGIALAGLLALGMAGSAGAASLSYSGSLSFGLATLPGASGPGSGTYVGPTHITSISFGAGQFGPVQVSLPVTSSGTIQSVRISGLANLSGTFTGLSAGPPAGGQLGMSGQAKICLVFATACGSAVVVPLSPTASTGMGVGGTQSVPGAVAITMQHAAWTVGQPAMTLHTPNSTISTPTLPGGIQNPFSGTAVGSGVLQLVTVSKVYTSLITAFPELPVFAALTLHFVPEPGTLLLLGSGVVGLAVLGRKRRR